MKRIFRYFTFVLFICLFFSSYKKDTFALDFSFKSPFSNSDNVVSDNSEDEDKKVNQQVEIDDGEYKTFSKIGISNKAIYFPMKIFYIGIDINWMAKRMGNRNIEGVVVTDNITDYTNFFKLFHNFNAYFGWRMHKYFGLELAYIGFLNTESFAKHRVDMNGMSFSVVGYTPAIDLKYTTLELYGNVGGFFLMSSEGGTKTVGGARFGTGIQAKVYGQIAFRVGVDYYSPVDKLVSNGGILTLKTGFQMYFSFE